MELQLAPLGILSLHHHRAVTRPTKATSTATANITSACSAEALKPRPQLPPGTYDALVTAASALREAGSAAAVLWHMESSGFQPDQYMWNRVLGMYLACGMLAEAREVFAGMPARSRVTWGVMMGGLVDGRKPRGALALFGELWGEMGVGAGPRVLVVAVRAATALGSVRAGQELHCCVAKMGACEDQYLPCALVDMYSKCGRLDEARRVFDGMPWRSVVAWNTMLAAYLLHGCAEEAVDLYHDMCECGVVFDQFTFSTMLGVFSRLGLLEHAKQIHASLIQSGLHMDIVGNTALVDLYCKWGRMEDARHVFERMPSRNLISWNALIAGYGYHGMGAHAIEMFERLIAEGIAPNHVTYLGVLNACRFSGFIDKGKRIFQLMAQNPKTKPRAMHYACVIELFGQQGLLDEAYSMIRKAPFTPTANMWGALLTACRIRKNIQLARLAAEQLLAMEPQKVNNYIVLLNLYISSGRQDEALKVVNTLNGAGLCMSNACSWITVKKKDHRFFFKDSLHPKSSEIYRKLHTLMEALKELGYVAEEDELLPDILPDELKTSKAYHSERLAVAFGIISTSPSTPLTINQSHRLCRDCHKVMKLVAQVTKREIVVRDGSRFHHFKLGTCSCGDYW